MQQIFLTKRHKDVIIRIYFSSGYIFRGVVFLKRAVSLLLILVLLLSAASCEKKPSAQKEEGLLLTGEQQKVTYRLTGERYLDEGYACGTVTLPEGGSYSLYWSTADSVLANFAPIAENVSGSYTFEAQNAIPLGADRLAVYETDGLSYVDSVLLGDKAIKEEAYFDFGTASDVHIEKSEKGADKKWTNTLSWFNELSLDYVFVSGDLSTNGSKKEYYELYRQSALASGYPYENIIEARGNHDSMDTKNYLFYTASDGQGTRDAREVPPYEDCPYFYQLIEIEGQRDVLVIVLQQEISNDLATPEEDNFSDEQIAWFESVLKQFAGTDTNIFVLFHPLMLGFGPGDTENGVYNYSIIGDDFFPNNLKFSQLLTEYKEVIWMSGHTHIDFREGVNFDDEDGTAARMIHNPSNYAPNRLAGESMQNNWASETNGSEGYVGLITPSHILYYGADFSSRTLLPAYCYILDSYTEDRSQAVSMEITSLPVKTNYAIGDRFDPRGIEVTATMSDGTKKVVRGWGYDEFNRLTASQTSVTLRYGSLTASIPITVGQTYYSFTGDGTKESPYLIQNEDDFYHFTENMRQQVGTSINDTAVYGQGLYFKQTANLDMTGHESYRGIYITDDRLYGFAGEYDGDGHTLTVSLTNRLNVYYDTCVFPCVTGTVKNLEFAGVLEGKTAQPIYAIGQTGQIRNCIGCIKLSGEKLSCGCANICAGTVCGWYGDGVLSGTKSAMVRTDEGGSYVACYTHTVDGDGNAIKCKYATPVDSPSQAVGGINAQGADKAMNAEERMRFGSTPAVGNNVALSGTAFDNRGTDAAAKAFDGDDASAWQFSSTHDAVTVIGVLFDEATVSFATLHWEEETRAKEGHYTLEYTADGETWQELPNARYTYSPDGVHDTVEFGPVPAKGIRAVITDTVSSKDAPKLYEMAIY